MVETLEGVEIIVALFFAQLDELGLFERLMESPPVQVLFVTLVVCILAIIWLTVSTTRATNKNVAAQDKQSDAIIANNARLTETIVASQQLMYEMARAADDNYLALSTLLKRVDEDLIELQGAVEGFGRQAATYLIEEAALHGRTRQVFKDELRGTLVEYADIIAQQRATIALGVQFQFPLPDDLRWTLLLMRPVNPDRAVKIFNLPIWHDGVNVGVLDKDGEIVRCITHTTVAGFYAIIQKFGTKEALNGWVDQHAVVIEILIEKVTTSNEETL